MRTDTDHLFHRGASFRQTLQRGMPARAVLLPQNQRSDLPAILSQPRPMALDAAGQSGARWTGGQP